MLVLDAGTGIRGLGLALAPSEGPLHILLTHLHLDHIQGLMFFAPMFRPQSEVVDLGPGVAGGVIGGQDRALHLGPADPGRGARASLPPVVPRGRDDRVADRLGLDPRRSVAHRGPTLGYRIDADGSSVCYIPDHEPGLGASLAELDEDWISGLDLARDASLLIHDCQYTDDAYPDHLGWGHSALSDALAIGHRARVEQLLLFHHDPLHSDEFLDLLGGRAAERASEFGRPADWARLAKEGQEIEFRRWRARLELRRIERSSCLGLERALSLRKNSGRAHDRQSVRTPPGAGHVARLNIRATRSASVASFAGA